MVKWSDIVIVAVIVFVIFAIFGWLDILFWMIIGAVVLGVIGFVIFVYTKDDASTEYAHTSTHHSSTEERETGEFVPATTTSQEIQKPPVIDKNRQTGYMFERYVIHLFEINNRPDWKYFEVDDWTRDIDRKSTGVYVRSNLDPDLTISYNRREYFAVECKYRSHLTDSDTYNCKVLKWSYPKQISRYLKFQEMKNIPVFIVIGVGGEPDNPKQMYCFPLNEHLSPEIPYYKLQHFWRNPTKPFFWKDGNLH